VNTLFLAYVGASLPLLVLFVTSGDPFGTVATAEAVAVEVVRTLCGSVGLIAAVPLTTVLAAGLAPPSEPEPAAAGRERDEPAGRVAFAPAGGLAPEAALALFDRVLLLHGPRLSHATVAVDGGDWLGREALPDDARRAAVELRRLAAAERGGGPWYRRALQAGGIRLDLREQGQLDLLRRFGPFSSDTRVFVDDDPGPVVETAEALGDLPRITYRLDAGELDRLRELLAGAGLRDVALVPRRSRAGAPSRHRR
jgi:hypothetical protein